VDDPQFIVREVITQPDKPVGRKQILTAPMIKVLAESLNLPITQPGDINALDWRERQCDYLVVVAYGQILSTQVLASPSIAPVNLHASLLPQYRCASPMQTALLNGDSETGVSVQRMVEKLDAGPVIARKSERIDARETAETLSAKLSLEGAHLLLQSLRGGGDWTEEPQDESRASVCRKLNRQMGIIHLHELTAVECDRYVRALNPWPGVRTNVGGNDVKIIETVLTESENSLPIPCADGSILYIERMQSPGKRVMSGAEWGRGRATTVDNR
jgi:methionyl-tRNA formyltransferase